MNLKIESKIKKVNFLSKLIGLLVILGRLYIEIVRFGFSPKGYFKNS